MVAREGLGSMRGLFQSAGKFDQCLRDAGMECTHIGDGEVECVLTVPESLSNTYGTMHGGAVSTVIDVLGTMALLTKDHTRAVRPPTPAAISQVAPAASERRRCWVQGVSVDMNMTFCSAARTGEELLCAPYLPPSPKPPSLAPTDGFFGMQPAGSCAAVGAHDGLHRDRGDAQE